MQAYRITCAKILGRALLIILIFLGISVFLGVSIVRAASYAFERADATGAGGVDHLFCVLAGAWRRAGGYRYCRISRTLKRS
jgi:hypothetical protein